MLSCLASSALSAAPEGLAVVPFFDVPLFHDRLSFLRNELMDDGVGGSSGSEAGGGDLVPDLAGLGARGPDGFCWGLVFKSDSVTLPMSPVLGLLINSESGPFLGSEEDKKGEMLGLPLGTSGPQPTIDSDELVPPAPDALSRRE